MQAPRRSIQERALKQNVAAGVRGCWLIDINSFVVSRDVKERPGLGVPLNGPVLGTTLNRLVVHRDVKERAGLGVPQSRPDLGRSLNCHDLG